MGSGKQSILCSLIIIMDYQFYSIEKDSHLFEDSTRGKTSLIPWEQIPVGCFFFLPNSMRTESSIKHDARPKIPKNLKEKGYNFTTRKSKNQKTGEWGLRIIRLDEGL